MTCIQTRLITKLLGNADQSPFTLIQIDDIDFIIRRSVPQAIQEVRIRL